ncbi:MAG: hypothetical protein Q8941_03770 [Bacteroidota bacterium]|nr:hypothetical protein [Bacteroidota bacterium]
MKVRLFLHPLKRRLTYGVVEEVIAKKLSQYADAVKVDSSNLVVAIILVRSLMDKVPGF